MNLMKKAGIAAAAALLLSVFGAPAHAADANRQAERQAFRTAITEYRATMLARRSQVVAIRTAFRSAVATAKASLTSGCARSQSEPCSKSNPYQPNLKGISGLARLLLLA